MNEANKAHSIRNDLPPKGRKLLAILVEHIRRGGFQPGNPDTYLGYKQCAVALGAGQMYGVPWGRWLQHNGLTSLNEWTIRHDLPRLSGLIVNQSGERQYFPGGDYFESNQRSDMDFDWWEDQAHQAGATDWQPYL